MKAQEPLIPTTLYKMVASTEAAIFKCQCDYLVKTTKAVVKPIISRTLALKMHFCCTVQWIFYVFDAPFNGYGPYSMHRLVSVIDAALSVRSNQSLHRLSTFLLLFYPHRFPSYFLAQPRVSTGWDTRKISLR